MSTKYSRRSLRKRGNMIEMVVNALPCRDCGLVFEREKKRGRPPVRCQDCKDKVTVEQELIVSQVDPETLFIGPKEELLGNRSHKPQGSEAQCIRCNRVFTSDSSCESHKDYGINPPCLNPANLGMVAKDRRGIPVWVKPSGREFE